MTLAFVGLAILLLVVSGYVAAEFARGRSAPGRQADRALVVLVMGLISALACMAGAVHQVASVWGYDATPVRVALERADPVGMIGQHVPSAPGAGEWAAIALMLAWIVVGVALWIRDARSQATLRRLLRASAPARTTGDFFRRPAVGEALQRWGKAAPNSLIVVDVDSRVGPVTWGLRRRTIGLPATSWDDGVLVHELAHAVRGDGIRAAILRFTSRFAWFAPVVQVAVRRARFMIELAVDDMVIRGGVDRLDYADTLLDHARRGSPNPAHLLLTGATTSTLGRRVSRLVKGWDSSAPETVRHRWSIALLAVSSIGVAGLSDLDRGVDRMGCAVGTERVTVWRHLHPDGMSAEFRWWGEECEGQLNVRGPLVVTVGGQLMIPTDSDAHFRLEVDSKGERLVYDLRDGLGEQPRSLEDGVLVVTPPALGEVPTFLFRETGWDGNTWTREVARTEGVDGLLLQSRLAHDPTVKAKLVATAVAAARVGPFVDLIRESEPDHRSYLLDEVAGNGRRSEVRRKVIEAALALPSLHFD